MAGSTPFLIEQSENFERSFKKLAKLFKVNRDDFIALITNILEGLVEDPYPPKSRQESLPSKLVLPEGWTFHKLEIRFAQGASGLIRLMYLVNETDFLIRLVWIYNHEQFAKRPADKDLQDVIKEILEC